MKSKINFTQPSRLLTTNNAKTIKGLKKKVNTHILYMSPYTQNDLGVNLCSHATIGCANACLFNSGFGGMFNNVQKARINKSNYFLADKKAFMLQLVNELKSIVRIDEKNGFETAVRLNGTTDIAFEKIKVINDFTIFDLFPNVQFYDYTKNPKRMSKELPSNYDLTFSRSENNDYFVNQVLNNGGRVAIVFETAELPKTFRGFEVVNGDEDDLTYKKAKGVILGLRYKKKTNVGADNKSDFNGFVIRKSEWSKEVLTELEAV